MKHLVSFLGYAMPYNIWGKTAKLINGAYLNSIAATRKIKIWWKVSSFNKIEYIF